MAGARLERMVGHRRLLARANPMSIVYRIHGTSEGTLTLVAADGGAVVRAEAFACAHVHRAKLSDPPQQNVIR